MTEVPRHWEVVPLDEVGDVQLGKMLDKKRKGGELLPYLRNINVRWGHIDLSDLLQMPFKRGELERFSLRDGDVLVCEGGEPGRAAVWRGGETSVKYQKALHRVRLRGGLEPRWLVNQLLFDASRGGLARQLTGTTIRHLTRTAIKSYPLRVAPLDEQHRIVSAIESYFTRLDDAVASLKRVQRNLKRYRASVLKAAVEGRLVPTEAEAARQEGRDYEPADVLLKRILAERRRRWEEAELAKMKAAGKPSRDDRWKAKYKGPVEPNTEELPELPEGWCWASIDQLGTVSGGLTMNAKRSASAGRVSYLRVANVYANELRLDEVKEIGVSEGEIDRVTLRRGDLLVVEGNGSVDQIGRVALWDGSIDPCVHQNHLIKVRFSGTTLPVWTLWWLLSPRGRRTVEAVASSTSGLHTLSLTKVSTLTVPVPPEAEQGRITAEVDRLLSLAGEVNREGSHARHRSGRLRQSILKWAFEGRLVDQNPTDEPASALLERIKAERETSTPRPKRKPAGETKVTA